MQLVLALVLLLVPITVLADTGCVPSGWKFFTQKLDHANESETRTFQQAYITLDTYYKPGGPILFIAGFEATMPFYEFCGSATWNPDGAYLGAFVIAMEHRYYGQSLPFGNQSFTLDAMQWLTIDNAVADYANFITQFKANNATFKDAPVVAFGGSYGALLSALLRIQYPDVVVGSVASAAPMFLYTSGIDGDLYFQTVSESYQKYYPTCAQQITKSFTAMKQAFASQNYAEIQHELNLCAAPSSWSEIPLADLLKALFANLIQFNYPDRGTPVASLCNSTLAQGATWGTPLYQAVNLTMQLHGACYSSLVGIRSAHSLNSLTSRAVAGVPTDQTAWMYQVCKEFVQPQSGVGIFVYDTAWSYPDYLTGCSQQFPGIVNTPYPAPLGSYAHPSINATSIIFANGLMDPIRTFSPAQNLSSSVVALNIPYSCHCEDINAPPRQAEAPEIAAARQQEIAIISEWIDAASRE